MARKQTPLIDYLSTHSRKRVGRSEPTTALDWVWSFDMGVSGGWSAMARPAEGPSKPVVLATGRLQYHALGDRKNVASDRLRAIHMPHVADVWGLLLEHFGRPRSIVVEEPAAYGAKTAVIVAWRSLGRFEQWATSVDMGESFTTMPPRVWQTEVHGETTDDKQRTIDWVKRTWRCGAKAVRPEASACTTDQDGLADAIAIGYTVWRYFMRMEQPKPTLDSILS